MNVKDFSEYFAKQAQRFESLDLKPGSDAYKLMLRINNSPYHFLDAKEVTEDADKLILERLVGRGYVDHIPANTSVMSDEYGRRAHVSSKKEIPERYVLTGGGSHAINSFISDM